MSKPNCHLLITRPEQQGKKLASTLSCAGYTSLCQPFFDYQAKDNHQQLTTLLEQVNQPLLIFVSTAAVKFANQLLPINQWSASNVIAIGRATEKALISAGMTNVITPAEHTSEGLLALECIKRVDQQDVIIIRGDGGRELIAAQLQHNGARVHYFESYKKNWLTLAENISEQWLANKVNCVLITSNALLETVVQLIKNNNSFWQNTCLWLVVSERIAHKARSLGLKNVICTYGANDNAILDTLRKLE